ncbi:hypothetical protein ACQVTT_30505, partial [Bacillus mycoides]|uniref:hypothetical protein n=1 Tax=Bacillus mycoides TaxID=1405 RepID=UPI003D64B7C0
SSFDDVLADKLRWHFDEEAYIDDWPRYRTSRARYFKGIFQVREKGYNAIESFQVLMYPDDVLNRLGSDRELQKQHNILQGKDQSAADYQAKLNGMLAAMRMVRRDSGFFLAQSHFDNGSVSTAANWLERLQSKSDAQRWSDGIDYLLARALEGRKDYNNAIDAYKDSAESESTQQHGNLIRARLLKQQVDLL